MKNLSVPKPLGSPPATLGRAVSPPPAPVIPPSRRGSTAPPPFRLSPHAAALAAAAPPSRLLPSPLPQPLPGRASRPAHYLSSHGSGDQALPPLGVRPRRGPSQGPAGSSWGGRPPKKVQDCSLSCYFLSGKNFDFLNTKLYALPLTLSHTTPSDEAPHIVIIIPPLPDRERS